MIISHLSHKKSNTDRSILTRVLLLLRWCMIICDNFLIKIRFRPCCLCFVETFFSLSPPPTPSNSGFPRNAFNPAREEMDLCSTCSFKTTTTCSQYLQEVACSIVFSAMDTPAFKDRWDHGPPAQPAPHFWFNYNQPAERKGGGGKHSSVLAT